MMLEPATAPTPESMLSVVAPVTLQVSVTEWPGATTYEDAVKDSIVGAAVGAPPVVSEELPQPATATSQDATRDRTTNLRICSPGRRP